MNSGNKAVIKPALQKMFYSTWQQHQIFFFSAPCGFGKTYTAKALLEGHRVCEYNVAEETFSERLLDTDCDTILIDEFQFITQVKQQDIICNWIKANTEKHFILLSRGPIPGWLMPFRFSGLLQLVDTEALTFEIKDTTRYFAQNQIMLSPQEQNTIHQTTQGYPMVTALLCAHMKKAPFSESIFDKVKQEMFFHFETAIYKRFDAPIRKLLLALIPFEHFGLEHAKLVSGDNHAGELISVLKKQTNILLFDGHDTFHFWPIFRSFLLWELKQEYSLTEQKSIYSRAGLCYELQEDYGHALECYSACGEHQKVSELLNKNAELHPGVGHYYEMEKYYFEIPKEEVLRSPSLMCGMSMLTSLCLDFEQSEQWYRELQGYSVGLKKTDGEYKDIQEKLAYLDIALPQRGSGAMIEMIGNLFRVMTDRQMKIPAFSVTSTLPSIMNGGKDFCEWSKRDDLLYATMKKPVELVLGRDGVGLADCAICESKFEKGEDITDRLLGLMGKLNDIQSKGTPDIEFAVLGLLVRKQIAKCRPDAALETLANLRKRFVEIGENRFLANLDAMTCRVWLYQNNMDQVMNWYREKAPANGPRLRALWRYRYLTKAMVMIKLGEYDDALLVLAPLIPYALNCARTMDEIYIRLLMAICHYRQQNAVWKEELLTILDRVWKYRFIEPVAQYGAAILPMLSNCGWKKDKEWFDKVMIAVRAQTVNYPDFLKKESELLEPLSATEAMVLKLLCYDMSNQEIGDVLGIKLTTVKTHVNHIMQKLGVNRRVEAIKAAERLHLV